MERDKESSMLKREEEMENKIGKLLNETLTSNATHGRKLKELREIHSNSNHVEFSIAFTTTVSTLFTFPRRSAPAERALRFISAFATSDSSSFSHDFLRFLLVPAAAANRTARFRACQMISEIILRLPDDAEVSNDLWDEVIDCLKTRVADKLPLIRIFSVRALSRFANDSDNCDILELFLQTLSVENSSEVRKTIVMSLPVSSLTSSCIIERTLDVSESVRRSAYFVIANKFPLQSLSIKLRTTILERGLSDRSTIVRNECMKLLSDEWFGKCCNGEPILLLKYLDAETYESVAESVMSSLFKSGVFNVKNGKGLHEIFSYLDKIKEMSENYSVNGPYMEPEIALFWRMVCEHLHKEAKEKGQDAAATMGTEAAVYAAEAADCNDLLEKLLPETVSDYIKLVKTHLFAGRNHRFVSRQLLFLGRMLDFSDATNRRSAGIFIEELLRLPLEYEEEEDGRKAVVGDGVSLGGDTDWAEAVSSLAGKVFALPGEFERVVLRAVKELGGTCKDRTADALHWMHCLSVLGFLLENTNSRRLIEETKADLDHFHPLHSLLLPGVKNGDVDVQRAAVRCMGILGLLERGAAELVANHIIIFARDGPAEVRSLACKALIDLRMWHGPLKTGSPDVAVGPTDRLDLGIFDMLSSELTRGDGEEDEAVKEAVAEGSAKILLLGESYPDVSESTCVSLLTGLVSLYFRNETDHLSRLKQCLSVFFDHYPSLSDHHKSYVSRAFVPVMRSLWPGIGDITAGSPAVISALRKRAVRASLFMLEMMRAPSFVQNNSPPPFPSTEEGLAIRIAHQVIEVGVEGEKKKTGAERAYMSALCRVMVMLRVGGPGADEGAVRLVRVLLGRVAEAVSGDRDTLKELRRMGDSLTLPLSPPLSSSQAHAIFGELGLTYEGEVEHGTEIPTPAAPSTRKRRVRVPVESSSSSEPEEEVSLQAMSVINSNTVGARRSRRTGITETMTRLTLTSRPQHGSDFEDDYSDNLLSDDGDDGDDDE